MNELKMRLVVRDITVDKEFTVILPVMSIYNDTEMVEDHEYLIVDHDGTLPVEEFSSVTQINELLQMADDNNYSKETLEIMSETYLLSEIAEILQYGSVEIIDFTKETSGWGYENGAMESNDNFGRVMYEQGYNFLPCEVPEDLMDYIEWTANWTAAESAGWRAVRWNSNYYLVRGGV